MALQPFAKIEEWKCPKCNEDRDGADGVTAKHRSGGVGNLTFEEHIEMECNCCGYRWAMECADK